ncbi:hypothetical protein Pelo_511 [Pelomyxa schiedti]|nr:hypothetical protein Pelo_511 [Pelomyxa schiedti]
MGQRQSSAATEQATHKNGDTSAQQTESEGESGSGSVDQRPSFSPSDSVTTRKVEVEIEEGGSGGWEPQSKLLCAFDWSAEPHLSMPVECIDAKVTIVGDRGTGKTSLSSQLLYGESDHIQEKNIDAKEIYLSDINCKMEVWDIPSGKSVPSFIVLTCFTYLVAISSQRLIQLAVQVGFRLQAKEKKLLAFRKYMGRRGLEQGPPGDHCVSTLGAPTSSPL